ncbi:protein kinase domain-containing protein [Edaphobacter aggregans]|uniref:protein kinase domain-containing protein n=1 Tax=Edaphobacter aggregans TaxID=570835 RepID=UPI00068B1F9E|nr:protein kinase [Edaphobacter aggregans]
MALSPGTRLGPYEILALVGAGGMGEVYRARDTRLGRDVAIKILSNHLSSDPDLKRRFEREARAVSSLTHPNICCLYDIGSQDGIDFIVMEYLEGETLADRLTTGLLPLQQALKIGVEIADALDKAHQEGIIHRDLKPGNIMLTKSGAKLMDFGLAKPVTATIITVSRASSQTPCPPTMSVTALPAPSVPVTERGTILGTLLYMAPETIQGQPADVRSDIFSFGCVLYEMVSGRRPFTGESRLNIAAAILEKDPQPLSSLQPLTPAVLEHVVLRCVMKDPGERWQSSRDLSRELKWISEGVRLTQASEPAPRPRGRLEGKLGRRLAWGVAALCFATLAWLGVSHWRSIQSAESRPLRLSLLPPPSTSFVPYNFAISPDGRRLAFVAAALDGGTALWIRSLAAGAAQQLTGTEGATWPFWSPDSRQVGFFQASKLKSVDPSSGAVQILCDAPGGYGGAWNDRGTIIFTGYQMDNRLGGDIGIFKVPASGGEPQLVTKGNAPNAPTFWPSALPDGDHFLYFLLGSSKSAQKQGIYVGSLSTQESKLISSEIVGNTQFASSRLYYVRDRSLMAQSFDLKRLQLTGRPEAVSRQELEEAPAFSRTGFSVSDNGVVVFQSATESVSRLAWFDRSGKELEELPRTGYRDPALSRDGALLAVSSDEEHNGKHYIHIYDFARGTSTRVSDGGTEVFPVLSPDGKRVAYEVNNARTSQYIDVAATDGSGKLERLAASDFLIPNDWSGDGRFLLFMNFQQGAPPSLDFLDLRTHSQTTYATGAEAQFSPDGKWIAFTGLGSSGSGEGSEVYVGRFPGPGRRIQISNHGGAQARWRADGKELFYITMDKKLMAVAIDTSHDEPVAGVPHVLFQTRIIAPRIALFQYAVSPDGSRFLINSMPSVGAAPLTVLMN